MRRLFVPAVLLLLVAGLGGGVWAVTRPAAPTQIQASISVAESLGGAEADTKFARATEVRQFVFPADHGPHDEFRTEWWYYTGNLVAADGRRFGYQLTFFRSAQNDQPVARQSEWATNNIYMAHFALTDVQNTRFYAFERYSRDAAGLAGASGNPFRVFLEDWSASGPAGTALPMRLQARVGDVAIDLSLESTKPPTLQGDRGLHQKGDIVGNASYYYSLTSMPTTGSVTAGGETLEVTGNSWMDREWTTLTQENDAIGWDWFALQLDDGREVMAYILRRTDGSIDKHSGGTMIYADGTSRQLGQSDFQLEVLERWTTPRADATAYPAKWRVSIPSEGIDLTVTPQIADQELQLAVRYWEGTVRIEGSHTGYGYVELTGYGDGDKARAE